MPVPALHTGIGPSFIERSFAGGEIAPSLYARADQVKYATGLRTCRNFIVQRHGGVSNRPGTRFIEETKDSAARARLIRFVFNDAQAYILEFGNQYIRFYRNGARIAVSGVAAWSGATSYVVSDLASLAGVNYYCILAHTNHTPPNATYWYPLTGTIYEIPTPYVTADLYSLIYKQSADVVTITHPSYDPRELSRTAETAWKLAAITFGAAIAAPANLVVTPSGAGAVTKSYVVTAVNQETFEESVASAAASGTGLAPSAANVWTLAWNAVSGAVYYNVYRAVNGIYSFIGTAGTNAFSDDGSVTPDISDTPPAARNPFSGANNRPSAVSYFQQRRVFANSNNDPEAVWASRSGLRNNFMISSPLQNDDAVTFRLQGSEVNSVRHMIELVKLVIFTSGGEWVINGNVAGILTPADVNQKQHGYEGSSTVAPLIVNGNVLYIQARGSIIRDLAYEWASDQYKGNDLTIFAVHLFDGYSIEDWAYQKIPNSVAWAVRNDGMLLGLTYIHEHMLWGWHRHDSYTLAGRSAFESVASIPAGTEDAVYCIVKRTVNGAVKRFIEMLESRFISSLAVDAFFVDCGLSYDGSGQTGTLTVTGGTNWTFDEDLTATLAGAGISLDATYIGDQFFYAHTDGVIYKFTIKAVGGAASATVNPTRTVPAALRATPLSGWEMARKDLGGLSHLEGETVNVLSDGNVEEPKTVKSGQITLQDPGVHVHAGLPITADLETLDLENPGGRTLADRKKNVNRVTLFLESTRGGKAGPDSSRLQGWKQRATEAMGLMTAPFTGEVEINVAADWSQGGRVFVRQDEPLPATILAIVPSGYV